MLTNNSGITQQAKEDIVIGTASPAELIEPAESECVLSTGPSLRESLMRDDSPDELVGSPKVDCEQSILLRPGECLLEDPNVSLPSVRQAIVVPESQSSWRKQKLREFLAKEFKESPAPESFKAKLISLLEEYHDVFSLEEGERGETDLVQLHIDTGDAQPQTQAACRIPFAVRREVARQLQQMQANGIIQPSDSPWASPLC